jgi:prepilin-type N-terminal cleavage/methylation domain-containing protein
MREQSNRAGVTLAELVVGMAILSIVLSMAAPRLSSARDAWAAAAARDAAIALITRARAEAVAHGEARLLVDPVMSEVRLEAPRGVLRGDILHVKREWGVALSVDRASAAVSIDFDGLGLGRLANRTFRFQRGAAEARLSLSTYGRPRRW